MLKSLQVLVGGLQDFSVSPSPLGTHWVFELIRTWLGLGLGGLGSKGFGSVLDNFPVNVSLEDKFRERLGLGLPPNFITFT